jgi:hypothetical protein
MDQWYLIRYHSESNRQQTAASKFLQWTESLRKNSFDLHKNGKLFSLRNIGLAAMCCLALSGCGSYFVQNSLTGALVTSPATVSFGSVMVGRAVSTTVDVLNKGVTPIQLSQLTVNGKAFSASGNSNLPVTLAVGETYRLNVNFNPASAGAAAGQLIITSNSSTSPKAAVTLIGTGVPNDATIVPALTAVSCSNDGIGDTSLLGATECGRHSAVSGFPFQQQFGGCCAGVCHRFSGREQCRIQRNLIVGPEHPGSEIDGDRGGCF